MMATTIMISTSVKPAFLFVLICIFTDLSICLFAGTRPFNRAKCGFLLPFPFVYVFKFHQRDSPKQASCRTTDPACGTAFARDSCATAGEKITKVGFTWHSGQSRPGQ